MSIDQGTVFRNNYIAILIQTELVVKYYQYDLLDKIWFIYLVIVFNTVKWEVGRLLDQIRSWKERKDKIRLK